MTERRNDELGRQVSEDERKLWREVKRRDEDEPYEAIRAVHAGNHCGLHETRSRQIVRTWANDGLVRASANADLVWLTTYGQRFDFE